MAAGVPFSLARRYAEIALAAAVVLIVSMMIVPLPTWALDALLAANIALSVLVLLAALFVRTPLAFGAFPTILLVTTLYRLALNVSSTRLILLQADAGRVIRAFGDFVVQGDYVVGAVVFLVLTLIQFVVVARGSERVAEVGARFTLDAMPGKQLAIDADMRAGLLDARAAAARRAALDRESQFYGSMDGAMKFVKGDAIAGLAITAINIVGGLAIGIVFRDMDAGASLRTYGLLTIGDGLVSQIPSLVISTAAGMVVTRVASEDAEGSLGRDVGTQIFGEPRALAVTAAFAAVLALVPGLPALPFALIAGGLGVVAWQLGRKRPARAARRAEGRAPRASAFSTRVGAALATEIGNPSFEAWLSETADRLHDELGVRLPSVPAEERPELSPSAWELWIEGRRTDAGEGLASLRAAITERTRARADALVGIQETQDELDRLAQKLPALVRTVVPERLPIGRLATLLRALVREGVSIAPLREILEALARDPWPEGDATLRATVRERLAPQLTDALRGSAKKLRLFALDPLLEDALREGRSVGPSLATDLIAAVRASVGEAGIVVTQADVRARLADVMEAELPAVRVISYRELDPKVEVERAGIVGPA